MCCCCFCRKKKEIEKDDETDNIGVPYSSKSISSSFYDQESESKENEVSLDVIEKKNSAVQEVPTLITVKTRSIQLPPAIIPIENPS